MQIAAEEKLLAREKRVPLTLPPPWNMNRLAQAMNERRYSMCFTMRPVYTGGWRIFHLSLPSLFFMDLKRPRDCRYHQLDDVRSVGN